MEDVFNNAQRQGWLSAGAQVGDQNTSCTAGGKGKWGGHCAKQDGGPSKIKHRITV